MKRPIEESKALWERVYARLGDVILTEMIRHNRGSDDPIVKGIMDAMLLIAEQNK